MGRAKKVTGWVQEEGKSSVLETHTPICCSSEGKGKKKKGEGRQSHAIVFQEFYKRATRLMRETRKERTGVSEGKVVKI